MLMFTEQIHYPATEYVRKCSQRQLHLFTVVQFLQLMVIMCVGFSSNYYIKMVSVLLIFALFFVHVLSQV